MSPSESVLLAALALPFLGAAVTPLVYRVLGERTAYFAAAVAGGTLLAIASQFGTHGSVVVPWIPSMGVTLSLYVDGLALLIGVLATGIGVLIFVYSGGYMHSEPGKMKYYATLLAFMGSMVGVAFAADLLALFVFWELTSISSFLLIGHYRDEADSQYAARKSMLITVAGGLFMLIAFLLLHAVSADAIGHSTFTLVGTDGSLIANAEAVRTTLEAKGLLVPVVVLLGVGAAAKAAQVPLHVWLPNAMEAPTPVSAFLHSATMVKAGVYLVGRFRPLLLTDQWTLLFVTMGLVTMTVTAMLAIAATDIKELLAYSTASHLGLIIAGFGLANVYGAETGAFHIVNHALFKAALFLVAGIVAHQAGTRLVDDLGGLWRDLPITAGVTVVAALGMAGVPPFNGFYSKELLFEATYEAAVHDGGVWWLLPVVAVVGSVFTFLYSIRFLSLFFGEQPDELGDVPSPPWPMWVPAAVLGALAAVVGLGGLTAAFGVHFGPLESFVTRVVESTAAHGGEHAAFSYSVPVGVVVHPTEHPSAIMSAVTIAVGVVLWPVFDRLRDGIRRLRRVPVLAPNWYYDGATGWLDESELIPTYVQTGLLRTYATAIMLAISALALGGYLAAGVTVPAFAGVERTLPVVLVLLVALVGAIAVTYADSHVAGVLTLSILGFMVAIFYILANAPDLALTQLVIETLVLVIFLLVLDKLPAFYGERPTRRTVRDAAVSLAVGVTVFATVLLSTAGTPEDVIASYFVERAPVPAGHEGAFLLQHGGGSNIVNVILVDFRAFDTMGEISVISMAALSVITVLAMRERGETQ
ncbi:MAG: hydrogen gas-evolving membrane-bound hydrogenase subunit E [Haloarculaceae archaeon]